MSHPRPSARPWRRAAVALLALVCALCLAAAAPSSAASTSAASTSADGHRRQKITFVVAGCPGCDVRLSQFTLGHHVWQGRTVRVPRNGRISWSVPKNHQRGLTASVVAPWERHEQVGTGYVAQVFFRYAGRRTGSHVTVKRARHQSRGTQCLAGAPDRRHLVVPVTIRKVRVEGVTGAPTDGTLAFASTTQPYVAPMTTAVHGVGGAQDVPPCGPGAEG